MTDVVEYEIAPDDIDGNFAPRAQPDVASVLVGNEIVLARVAAGTPYLQTCALNESGSVVWQCFDGSGTIDEIAADIADVFGADVDAVHADVLTVARDVGAYGFLVGVHEDHLGPDDPAGIAEGLPFPEFDARDEAGHPQSLRQLQGNRALLVSWSDSCRYCELIVDDLAGLVPALVAVGVELVLVAVGDARTIRASLDASRFTGRLWMQNDVAPGFDGLGTPVAYLVDEEGRVAEAVALGAPNVVALARAITTTA